MLATRCELARRFAIDDVAHAMRVIRARLRVAWSAATLATLFCGAEAQAQPQRACADAASESSAAAGTWPSPLDDLVSFRARGTSLRDALERLGALSGVALAYSSDVLPLDRPVCVVANRQPLGRVLSSLLHDTRVEAIVVAGKVVLTPQRGARDPEVAKVSVLERVIVTGSAVGASRRPLSIGVEVIDGERLRRAGHTSLSAALDASVPGVWLWDQAPGNLVAQYGGIRGASSFSTSYPKMYIDGVEVANPLLVTQLDPDVIDRIEVIRGPQGAALYGSDAISGVINVLTRHDGVDASGARIQVSSLAGASSSAFGPGLVPTHDERIALRVGSNLRSAGLALGFGQSGAVFPASQSRQLSAVGHARLVAAGATLNTSARLFDKRAGVGVNPLLGALATRQPYSAGAAGPVMGAPSDDNQHVRLYTLGASAAFASPGIWTHTLLAGVDGYALDNVADATNPFPFEVSAALPPSRGNGERGTLRASSVAQIGGTALTPATTLTVSVEHSLLRQSSAITNVGTPGSDLRYAVVPDDVVRLSNQNTGASAQASASWRDALFVTGGVRIERNDAFAGDDRYPLLPLLGVSVVRSFGDVELKLRSSYGKGIRPPLTPVRGAWSNRPGDVQNARTGLDPEVQTGIESGVELYFGRAFSLQATRFDQRATGLIQNVAVGMDTAMRAGVPERRMRFQLENVGEISNRGWELQASLYRGPVGLTGTFTTVDSRVRTVATGYLGDLRVGDRMLAVPARTASLSAFWDFARWSTTLTATRAGDWINYDRVALARAYASAGDELPRDVTGASLRGYWRTYTGQTHLRIATTRAIGRGLTLLASGDNLLGGQLGEPDNLTIRQGRTLTGGLRAAF